MIVKAPTFTLLATLALALGICANTTIFSLINGLLLRPLTGVKDPERIVSVYASDYSSGLYGASSYPEYIDIRNQADAFESLAAFAQTVFTAPGEAEPERLNGVVATGNYFEVLGVRAQLGRTLQPADDRAENAQTVVISDALWQRRFNRDPGVMGQTLSLNDQPYTIAGVVEPSFRSLRLGPLPELWLPMGPASQYVRNGRDGRGIEIIGRLNPGVTLDQAQTQLATIAARLAQAYPESNLGTLERPNEPRPITVVRAARIQSGGDAGIVRISFLLFAVVGLVLLIACANVANLLLARASVRRREIAVRLALGASRRRLVRQLLTESLLLALLGGAAGLLATSWTSGLLPKFFPNNEAAGLDLSLDWRVLVFTLGVTVLTGVLFGLVPALQATRVNVLPSLKDDAGVHGRRLRRLGLRDALVISQLALSLVLLISAALFVRSLQVAVSFDPGFAAQNLLFASMDTSVAKLNKEQTLAHYDQMLERTGTLPGVQSVTLSGIVPITGGGYRRKIQPEGYQPQPNEDTEINTNVIGAKFFETIGIPFVAGRDFSEQDKAGGPSVVIVNEEFARRYYGGNAVGKRLKYRSEEFSEIVGVVRTAKYRNVHEQPLPFVYIPLGQDFQPDMTLVVRTAGDPLVLAGSLRSEMLALNKDVPVFSVQTMSELIGGQLAADRMIAVLLSIFGAGALLLAAIGIYGVMAYSAAQRTREIGIRIALGAERRDILKLIIGQGIFLISIGAGLGLALALAATRVLQSLLFGVSATDPLTFGSVVLVLVGVALLACYLPARRATKVDPLVALRYE
jgi:macrolide transport system ATP-binding/permease protein